MAYWWETYKTTPADNDATPPDGAPEGMFPSAVNDCQRQDMAAMAELGGLIFAPNTSGPPPQSTPTSLADGMAQLVYDLTNPVGRMILWNSVHDGVGDAKPYPVPSGVTAVWQRCDGTNNTPDTRKKVIGGADPVDASPVFTGDVIGDADTGPAGAIDTQLAATDPHAITIAEMAAHGHSVTDPGHAHDYTAPPDPSQGNPSGNELNTGSQPDTTQPSFTGISIDDNGGGVGHSHGLSGFDIPNHVHGSDPLRTCIEYWQRTA